MILDQAKASRSNVRPNFNRTISQKRLVEDKGYFPPEILPPTLEDFQDYMVRMLTGNTLEVTDTARHLAHAVLYPDVGFLPGVSTRLLRFVTAGILPERFRGAYGLKWGRKQQFKLNCFSRSIRTLRPFAPAWLWESPLLGGKFTRVLLWNTRNSTEL